MRVLEDQIQIALIKWLREVYPDVCVFHIPNGGLLNKREAKKLQNMGVLPGVSDLFFPDFRMWLEIKTETGKLTITQKIFLTNRMANGDTTLVAYWFKDAQTQLKHFLYLREENNNE